MNTFIIRIGGFVRPTCQMCGGCERQRCVCGSVWRCARVDRSGVGTGILCNPRPYLRTWCYSGGHPKDDFLEVPVVVLCGWVSGLVGERAGG